MIGCDCSVDVDMVDRASRELVRKARKQHRCCECADPIVPGMRYQEASGITQDGDPYRYRTCLACAQIREDYCPSGWYWGGLGEQIWECLGFYYTETPEPEETSEIDAEDARRVAEHKARREATRA